MPLYDCLLLLKPTVAKESVKDLVARVGKHVYRRNGVVTDIKSFGTLYLGYGIRKRDGRYFQGQLMQLSVMTPPSFKQELSYLNGEDRLLRWEFIKNRDIKFGIENFTEDDIKGDLTSLSLGSNYNDSGEEEDDNDDDDVETDQSEPKA